MHSRQKPASFHFYITVRDGITKTLRLALAHPIGKVEQSGTIFH